MKFLGMKLLFILISLLASYSVFACTDIRVTAKDGTVLVARSMEFALDLKSNLRTSNRGRVFTTQAPDGKPGISWKAKYGYVFLDGLNIDMAIDGMNEKGLSFEALYLPDFAEYQTVPPGKNNQALPYFNFGDWILSNFDSVDQVREALKNVYVFKQILPIGNDFIFPLHFSIYDTTGKSIVVEYVGGKLNIHDNQIGVMTNSPTYDWHLTNLHNYINLTPENPNPVLDNGMTFAAIGQGFGMIGVPGDISPPSRFVKMATMLRVIIQPENAAGALNVAQHVINNVDIPLGLAREPSQNKFTNEMTQWVVFKDLTNREFYYRTYADTTLRGVSLSKINFAENGPRLKMSIAGNQFVQNMTDQLLKSTQ